ncbi:MAG TPA: hypothetical protein PKN48_10165 [Bacteroidales bacterium]|nr:hypothetical protein [Bacteroidales bacterium]
MITKKVKQKYDVIGNKTKKKQPFDTGKSTSTMGVKPTTNPRTL